MKFLSADIKLGYACDNRCKHCCLSLEKKQKHNLSFTQIKNLLTEVKECKFNGIILTGGEPLIRKDFLDIVEFSLKLKFERISIQTNGQKLANISLVEKIDDFQNIYDKNKDIIEFTIPIHSTNGSIHDYITQKPPSFKQTMAGLKNLAEFNIILHGKIIISKLNFSNLPEIIDLYLCHNAKSIDIAFPHALGKAFDNFEEIIPDYDDIRDIITKIIDRYDHIVPLKFETIPFCFYPKKPHLRHRYKITYTHHKILVNSAIV